MGTVTLTVGATGRQYTTLTAAFAAIPSSLVTDGNSYIVELHNDAEFALTAGVTLSGKTTDATHFITIKAAAGKSFRDNANVQTNALRYNAANGVAIRLNASYSRALTISADYTVVDGLQIKGAQYTACALDVGGFACIVKNCVLEGQSQVGNGNNPVLAVTSQNGIVSGNVIIQRSAGNTSGMLIGANISNQFYYLYNNTIISPSDVLSANGILCGEGTITCSNNAIFGFTTPLVKNTALSVTGTNNATDASAFIPGVSNSLTGLAATSQFPSVLNASTDVRLLGTSALKDAGTATNAPATAINTDTRNQGTAPDIGAWEIVNATAAYQAFRNLLHF